MIENMMQRRIFRPKKEAVIVEWRELHNVDVHNL
jgi:hypothetical protein